MTTASYVGIIFCSVLMIGPSSMFGLQLLTYLYLHPRDLGTASLAPQLQMIVQVRSLGNLHELFAQPNGSPQRNADDCATDGRVCNGRFLRLAFQSSDLSDEDLHSRRAGMR